jgi:ATP-dependent Clp protease ATP-binding subunit ClpC
VTGRDNVYSKVMLSKFFVRIGRALGLAWFTNRARIVLSTAERLALTFNCDHIGTEHLLLGLVKSDFGRGVCVLVKLGAKPSAIEEELAKVMKPGEAKISRKRLPSDNHTGKVIKGAIIESRALGYDYVGTEHLVVALLREDDTVASQVLNKLAVTYDKARELVRQIKGIDELGVDLNSLKIVSRKEQP